MFLNEEKIKKLKENWIRFPIVKQNCIWCNACAIISPLVFEISEDSWISIVKELDNYENNEVDDSINACPVSAIKWSI